METILTGLPAGVDDAVLNRGELAQALNKSEPTLDRYIADGMPFLVEGTNGRAWEFQLSACWEWLKAREKEDADRKGKAQQAVQQMRLALIGGNDVLDEERQLSPKQRQEAYDAERSFMLAALQRGDLVRRSDVVTAFEDVFKLVKESLTALPDRFERELGLSGKAVDLATRLCDGTLAEMEHRASELAGRDELKQAAE